MSDIIIAFSDGLNSDGYTISYAIIGSVGTIVPNKTTVISSMDDYLKKTGGATHIALLDSDDVVVRLYPKTQVLSVSLRPKHKVLYKK